MAYFGLIIAKRSLRNSRLKDEHAGVLELADSLDSGSSVHYGRAGSSPASRTKVLKLKGFSLEFFYIRFLVVVEN